MIKQGSIIIENDGNILDKNIDLLMTESTLTGDAMSGTLIGRDLKRLAKRLRGKYLKKNTRSQYEERRISDKSGQRKIFSPEKRIILMLR